MIVNIEPPKYRSLGISIVGGTDSPDGPFPIYVKRILRGSVCEDNGILGTGDELVAVNDKLLVEVTRDFAVNTLSYLTGYVRLLVLQDYY